MILYDSAKLSIHTNRGAESILRPGYYLIRIVVDAVVTWFAFYRR